MVLDTLGKRLNWDYGELWFVEYSNNQIVKSDITFLDDKNSDFKKLANDHSHVAWNLDECIPETVYNEKKAIWISDFITKYPVYMKELIAGLNINCGVAIPIFSGVHITAVLFFMSENMKSFNENQMDLFELLADRLGMLLLKINLEREMIQMKQELRNSIDLNFSTLNKILQYRDPYTVNHQKKVADIAVKIGLECGLSSEAIEDLILAAELHDIGKIVIPLEVLNKPGIISNEEFALIKTHVDISYDIISTLPCHDTVKRIIHEHHEREDGSGYPKKLKSSEISPLSKIIIVSDVISAMIEHRPYRKGIAIPIIIEELKKGRESRYDPTYTDIAIKHLEENHYSSASM